MDDKKVRKFVYEREEAHYMEIPPDKEVRKFVKGDALYLKDEEVMKLQKKLPFKEGWFVEYDDNDVPLYEKSVNALTDSEIEEILAVHYTKIEESLDKITSINTLTRIQNKAIDLGKSQRTMRVIKMRFAELTEVREG